MNRTFSDTDYYNTHLSRVQTNILNYNNLLYTGFWKVYLIYPIVILNNDHLLGKYGARKQFDLLSAGSQLATASQ